MGGWETNMKKNKVTTLIILIMTIGLLGAVIYFSVILNNQGKASVTQIKKTKASAQTYHKLLALNDVSSSSSSTSTSEDTSGSSSSSQMPAIIQEISPTKALPAPTLLAYRSTSPTVSPSPVVKPTIKPTAIPTSVPIISRPTVVPSPTVALLIYRTVSISPTLIPAKSTGGVQIVISPTVAKVPTGLVDKQLPQTGWVQLSTILFVVAATMVFVSFLF